MSLCKEVQTVLLVWDEATDLPEPIAVHVGACPECRARFDGIFPKVTVPLEEVQVARRRRFRPELALAPAMVMAGLAAVLALWMAPPRGEASVDLVELIPEECPAEVVLLECPVG
jgi:hypothetical protein